MDSWYRTDFGEWFSIGRLWKHAASFLLKAARCTPVSNKTPMRKPHFEYGSYAIFSLHVSSIARGKFTVARRGYLERAPMAL